MLNPRIVRYGTGNLGITVNGIKVLLTVDGEGQCQAAEALATAIVALGPEGGRQVERRPAPASVAESQVVRRKRFVVGQRVWCTVYACRGWKTVTEVHKDGRIKIDGGRVWCPLHNFEENCPSWQVGS